MRRRFSRTAAAALRAALALVPQPARAEIYATNEAMCEDAATANKPQVGEDAVIMKNACEVAAARRMHRAARLSGAAKQQELLMEATYLYFAAEGAAQLHEKGLAVSMLLHSRQIYQSVRDHPASAAMRRKGQLGLDTIGRTLKRR